MKCSRRTMLSSPSPFGSRSAIRPRTSLQISRLSGGYNRAPRDADAAESTNSNLMTPGSIDPLVWGTWYRGTGANLAGRYRVGVGHRHAAREECPADTPWPGRCRPFPHHADKVSSAFRVICILLDVVVPERNVEERSGVAVPGDGEFGDRHRAFMTRPTPTYPSWGANEHASPGSSRWSGLLDRRPLPH